MEERKLNFNAPLLSVRRFSTSVASSDGKNGKIIEDSRPNRRYTIPFYRSDLNLEQVTEPVAVPFFWEQTPGQPKDGGPEPQQLEEASVTPRLPPRRDLDIIKYPLEKEVEDRPKIESCSLIDGVTRYDCSKEGNEEKNLYLEDDDDVYSDAVDALSPTDSFSMSCSVSGVSGSDGPVIKRAGTFSTDPQTRDFMMSRFLPAAKAMALEPPQYASRRQPVAVEQPRQVVKVISEDRKPPFNESIVIPHYGEDTDEGESEDEVDEYDESGNLSSRGCGLFPRLCLNKSLCLLNPVPGLKVRTHSSMSSTSEVRKSGKATYAQTHSQTIKKHARDSVYKHQSDSGVQSPKLILGIENKMTNGSNRFTCSNEQDMSNRSSPYRRGISPYRNERPQSPFRGVGFLGVPKETENIRATRLNLSDKSSSKSQELLPYQSFKRGSGSLSPAVEKTLYVDTVKFAKISSSNSFSSDTMGQMDLVRKSFETSMGRRGIEETASAESLLQDVKCLNIAKGGNILETKTVGSMKAKQSSFSGILHPGELNQECKSSELVKVVDDGNLNGSKEQYLEKDDPGCLNSDFEQSPLPPPLPQKPSESWLWRTLPSVSSQNSFSPSYRSRFHPKRQDSNTSTKWETIVKTSYSHHDHKRYSEELTAHFSQQSKT
ncbi:uncharacterized protein LOC116140427 [Pistacia vera]|uniref:uncharacterized protein LOC116140427 n=1 Tax=Pistacia vera TaxID=55513 RepID=UPI00126384E6|nr:uncharacterized protein LOC116140427 [Pistacia vera]XP_031281918.1 uncharacterized protein LOC116140427 [Pistacia vera]